MAKDWTVTKQTQTMQLNAAGQWVDAMKIEYTTTEGAAGFIVVPLNTYTADTVRSLLDARVAQINEIAAL